MLVGEFENILDVNINTFIYQVSFSDMCFTVAYVLCASKITTFYACAF